MAEELQLALLGNPEIRRAGGPLIELHSSKALALLCYLAVTGRPHLRSTLAGLLWGDTPEANARNNLSKALTYLRHAVGSHLDTTHQEVAFDRQSPYWLDVEAFEESVSSWASVEQLQRAVELYRGDLMEEFDVRQAVAFDEWVLAQRARLRALALRALHTLAVHHTRRGTVGHAAATEYTARLLALEPWREEAHRQLMILLARSGQRGAALAQYEACRRVLADELGVEPGAETTALYERIRDGELSSDREGQEARGPPAASSASLPFLHAPLPSPTTATPFVARERELAQLNSYLEKALALQGRVVFVTGEAGTGKTALVQAFAQRAQERYADLIVAGGNCNAYTGVGDPYLPFREILGRLTGNVEARWAAGVIGPEQAYRVRNLAPHAVQMLMKAGPDLIDVFVAAPILADHAVASAPDGARWPESLEALLANRERRQSRIDLRQVDLFEQYAVVMTGLARQHPLLLVVDDLQWADAGSINLLFHLGRRLEGSRILVVGIYRRAEVALGRHAVLTGSGQPERHPLDPVIHEFQRLFGQIHVDLRQSEDKQFVEAVLDTEPNRLGAAFRYSLYQQTRGHALFTVEMLHGMQERGDLVQDQAGRWIESPNVDWETLPARVEGIIAERINRLPGALQEMLKVASVEGEDFTAEVVARVQAAGEPETVNQLSSELARRHRLVVSHGSQRLGAGGQRMSRYRFRHILFQKYMYNNLDEGERAYLHEAVGKALEQLYEGHTAPIAIQLARHCEAAGLELQAVDHLEQAGRQAVRSYAYQEALLLLDRAVTLLRTLPDTPERTQRELSVQTARGNTLITLKGFASPEAGRAYARAQELIEHVGATTTPQFFPVLWGLWVNCFTRAEQQMGRGLADQLLHLAQRLGDTGLLLQAHHALWTSCYFLGEFIAAQEHVEQGLAVYDSEQHHAHAYLYGGHDPGVCCLTLGAPILCCMGYPEQALQRSSEAAALARELSHPGSEVLTLRFLAVVSQFRREARAVQEWAEAAMALAAEHEWPFWAGWAGSLRGWALAQQGQGEEGITQVRRALTTFQSTGHAHDVPYQLALLAEAYQTVGQAEEALSAVDEALARAHDAGGCYYEAELDRLRGELLLTRSKGTATAEAEACFRQAIEVARRQEARSWELRAAISLSRLWQEQGKKGQAQHLLAEIYGWFTEGFDTADLVEAKALLTE